MGIRTCGACGGRGFTTESQWRPNPAGGMGQNITIRHNCNVCHGRGNIRTPDPPRPIQPGGGSGGGTRSSGGGSGGGAKVPWGFKKKKKTKAAGPGRHVGTVETGPDGDLLLPWTAEELATRRSRAAGGMFAFLAFAAVVIPLGFTGTWVGTLAPPSIAAGVTYLIVRRMGRTGVLLANLLLVAVALVPILWVVSLFIDPS